MTIGKTYANKICYEIPHENIPKIKLRKVRPGALRALGIKLHTRGTRAVPVKQCSGLPRAAGFASHVGIKYT